MATCDEDYCMRSMFFVSILTLMVIGLPVLAADNDAATRHSLRFMVMAEHESALRKVLRTGDLVFAFCVRQPDLPPGARPGMPLPAGVRPEPKWNETNFQRRLAMLSPADGKTFEKTVVFSTVVDLRSHAAQLPRDIAWVMYNSEEGMTPLDEIKSIDDSVRQFAELAHQRGWKMAWVPTNSMLSRSNDDLLRLASSVDCIVLQHQRLLQDRGVDVFKTETIRRARAIHKINPKCLVIVQVVLGRSTVEQSIEALKAVRDSVEGFCVWTMQDTQGAAKVIERVR
jgi:hypothetical protein